MNTIKKATGWILPIVIVGALLITLNTWKRTDHITPEEQKKIEQYENAQAQQVIETSKNLLLPPSYEEGSLHAAR